MAEHLRPSDSGAPKRDFSETGDLREQVRARKQELERHIEQSKEQFAEAQAKLRAQFDETQERIRERTGRNLPVAILIGLGLGALLIVSLFIIKPIFIVLVAAAVGLAIYELATALRRTSIYVPRIPSVLVGVATLPIAYFGGWRAQFIAVAAAITVVVLWRLIAPRNGRASHSEVPGTSLPTAIAMRRDLKAAVLIQIYVPLLLGFSVTLAGRADGDWWAFIFVVIVVAADTGAYAAGLIFGKHKLAPKISPGKTWEGFLGGVVLAIIVSFVFSVFVLHQSWLFAVLFGLVLALSATIGDLIESKIKRDLGVKDMSSLLPGHGGVLDRIDSILPSAAVAFIASIIGAHHLI